MHLCTIGCCGLQSPCMRNALYLIEPIKDIIHVDIYAALEDIISSEDVNTISQGIASKLNVADNSNAEK